MAGNLWGPTGSGGGSLTSVLWLVGGTYPTWASVMVEVALSETPVDVYVDTSGGPLVIPAGSYELHSSRIISSKLGDGSDTVTCDDGAELRNIGALIGSGLLLVVAPTAAPAMVFDYSSPAVLFMELSQLRNDGSWPAIEVPDSNFMIIISRVGKLLTGTAAIINAGVGSGVVLGLFGGATVQADVASSTDASALLIWRTDGTGPSPLPAQSGFSGSQPNQAVGPAASWPTANRPVSVFEPLSIGVSGYNTDLSAWESWDGAAWVSAAPSNVGRMSYLLPEMDLSALDDFDPSGTGLVSTGNTYGFKTINQPIAGLDIPGAVVGGDVDLAAEMFQSVSADAWTGVYVRGTLLTALLAFNGVATPNLYWLLYSTTTGAYTGIGLGLVVVSKQYPQPALSRLRIEVVGDVLTFYRGAANTELDGIDWELIDTRSVTTLLLGTIEGAGFGCGSGGIGGTATNIVVGAEVL